MSLLQMSISGGIMILAVIVIRALAINRLPKKTFIALWGIVLLRLLIPFSLPSTLSAYTLVNNHIPATQSTAELGNANIVPLPTTTPIVRLPTADDVVHEQTAVNVSPYAVVWGIGMIVCALFFAVSYFKCRREFRESLPTKNDFLAHWIAEHKLIRRIEIRQSSRISAPLTYGIFKPIILMPKNTNWEDTKQIEYILAHEFVHIRRFDTAAKLLLTAALCVHWFNPLVWAMYILFNRDIELSCDETVVRSFGETTKSTYARTLISMEEKKSALTPLCNSFSKNAIEERITAIMKMKKTSVAATLVAIALIVGVTTAFATSAAASDKSLTEIPNTDFAQSDNNQLLDRETLEIISSEVEKSIAPYVSFGITYKLDAEGQAKFYWNGTQIRGIYDEVTGIWVSNSAGNSTFDESVKELYAVYTGQKLTGLREATAQEQEEWTNIRNNHSNNSISISDNRGSRGTSEDYRLLLSLKTSYYQSQSVSTMNNSMLKFYEDNYDASERIRKDVTLNDYGVTLAQQEKAFVTQTFMFSVAQNSAVNRNLKHSELQYTLTASDDPDVWLIYKISFEISDPNKLTVRERDQYLSNVINGMQTFWNEKNSGKLAGVKEETFRTQLNALVKQNSSSLISIKIDDITFQAPPEEYTPTVIDLAPTESFRITAGSGPEQAYDYSEAKQTYFTFAQGQKLQIDVDHISPFDTTASGNSVKLIFMDSKGQTVEVVIKEGEKSEVTFKNAGVYSLSVQNDETKSLWYSFTIIDKSKIDNVSFKTMAKEHTQTISGKNISAGGKISLGSQLLSAGTECNILLTFAGNGKLTVMCTSTDGDTKSLLVESGKAAALKIKAGGEYTISVKNGNTHTINSVNGKIEFMQSSSSQSSNIPAGLNTSTSQTVTYSNVEMRRYEGTDGHPYIHDTKVNETTKKIIGYKYGMLAFDKDGNPLKIDWWSLDSEAESTYFYLDETLTEIAPAETYDVFGGWSLNYFGTDSSVEKIAYVLYCDKEITFEDGTIWSNPDFDSWRSTYEGEKVDVNVLKSYYPYEQTINFAK